MTHKLGNNGFLGVEVPDEWRPVVGNEARYHVSSLGRVKSLRRGEMIMKPRKTWQGRWMVRLYNGKNHYNKNISRLVAEAFIPNSDNYPEVNHKDGNKCNDVMSNLEWCTKRENLLHSKQNGLVCHGEKNGKSVLRNSQARQIKMLHQHGIGPTRLAKLYGKTLWAIKGVVYRRFYKNI